ncbi:hypothetical protein DFQ27_008888 [Actinomortierella ambigua]|uniref:Uncharacterized protein n=1 Tax=Actinomortierella ambigua TaxID=1343610 RepID=A0A9P6UBA9_9FUNG|nr:hypothetical protein DFQ27_008888 [Actinomortierella ambigua]
MKVSTCIAIAVASALALLSASTSSAHPVGSGGSSSDDSGAYPAPKTPTPKPKPGGAKPAPKPSSKLPSATLYGANNWKGKSAQVTKFGCLDLSTLKAVSSVRYGGGPKADIKFFSGPNCKGTVVHEMDTSSIKAMGGPYKTLSVLVSK